ncbi:chorion protein S15 [Drosophila suzukii]|uniref:Chorion protein S15 n=1 Tax=Drosophila suzukii TaxID=28584 RepID=A0AB39ZEH3_DROSZ
MRAWNSYLTIIILLITCCLDWTGALFFKSWKSGKGYGAVQNYGNNEYGGVQNYGYNGYGNYGYGNYGYGDYAGGYGYNYPNYPSYSSYSHSNGRRKPSGNRQGRTYSQIARVINPAPYVGPGGSKFLPHTKFSALWG